jgi:uncharacterized protein YdbL (DUF1318 family)
MSRIVRIIMLMAALAGVSLAHGQGNLEINTPAIAAIKSSMQSRHAQLAPYYASGAIGLAADGMLAVRDAKAVPIAQRGALNSLVAAENADRASLYKEIAQANGHPEWAAQVKSTFAQRWIDKAPGGWWVQRGGGWAQK